MINHKHKFIFIHIPKCAGTSIENSLKTIATRKPFGYDRKVGGFLQHLTCSEILHHDFLTKQDFDKHYKFAFVRNPFSRCVSEYIWRIKRYGNWINKPINVTELGKTKLVTKNDVRQISFKDFVKREFPWQEKSFEQHMKPQIEFTHDADMNLMVDYVGRFENLQQDFNIVCDRIGISRQQLPHDNKTNHKHYTEYYDDETREIVAKKYTKDIEYFGYEFGK
jgi:hypothetical protein